MLSEFPMNVALFAINLNYSYDTPTFNMAAHFSISLDLPILSMESM